MSVVTNLRNTYTDYLGNICNIDLHHTTGITNIPAESFVFSNMSRCVSDEILQYNGAMIHTGCVNLSLNRIRNLNRLENISKLEDDWNGYGSKAINKFVINIAENIINVVDEQPIIYPTGRSTIQMQYELADKSYLEFEIFEDEVICMKIPKRVYENVSFKVIDVSDVETINEIVRSFYGKRSTCKRIVV